MAIERVEHLVSPILLTEGFELVDIEYKKEGRQFFLRIYIDNENGVTLDDCQNISEQIGTTLEVEDVIHHDFILEVSSPGLERPLKKINDYVRFTSKKVKMSLYKPLDGKKILRGTIDKVEGETIFIKEEESNEVKKLNHEDVAKANLIFEFSGLNTHK